MAKELNMQFSGSIGPLVGCLRDGSYYYRSRPARVRQSKATKRSSNYFGLAAKAGKIMRLYLAQSIPHTKDIHMHRRLETAISNWLRIDKTPAPKATADIPFVNHFNFNPDQPLEEALRMPLSFKQPGTGLASLQLPAFVPVTAIKAPRGTTQLELCISAVALRLADDGCFGSSTITLTMPYNDTEQPAQQLDFDLQTRAGNILIAAVQLRFGVAEAGQVSYRKQEARACAAIVGAVYL